MDYNRSTAVEILGACINVSNNILVEVMHIHDTHMGYSIQADSGSASAINVGHQGEELEICSETGLTSGPPPLKSTDLRS